MLHLETIESHTLDILRRLQGLPELSNTRLVGGTALALGESSFGFEKSIVFC